MKWTYGIKNKLAASLVLLALCLLVLLSNYLDRLHTEKVKNSISTMYEDRLIVEDFILKMTRNVYQIREVLQSDDNSNLKKTTISEFTTDFKFTFENFSETRLTEIEETTAIELIATFMKFEQVISNNKNVPGFHTDKILSLLDKLSAIQLSESKLIMKEVESQYSAIKASSQFAYAIIIIILIVLQVLVFSGESLIPKFKQSDPNLN
jgi:hypothetical protein